jgi:hypothetical protein
MQEAKLMIVIGTSTGLLSNDRSKVIGHNLVSGDADQLIIRCQPLTRLSNVRGVSFVLNWI